jgi:PAS domain S-box-containing protein
MIEPGSAAARHSSGDPARDAPGAPARDAPGATAGHGPIAPAGKYLAAIVELSPQILCVADDGGTILWCNESMDLSLGYGPGELVGSRMGDMVHPDDLDVIRAAEAAMGSGGEVSGVRARYRCRDGTWRWLEWTTRLDVARRLAHGAARDVTGRREAEEELGANEGRLRAIVESSPSSIFVKDLNGRYLFANRQWSRITGIPAANLVGVTANESWPFEAASIAERDRVIIATGSPTVSTDHLHTRKGVRDFIVSRFLMRDDQGSPYAIGGIATDITERIEAETTLAGRERLLATVLQASPDIITLLDAQGRVRQVSDVLDVLGWTSVEPGEGGFASRIHPEDVDLVADAFRRMMAGAFADLQIRYRVRHASGQWITLDSRGQAISDDTGAVVGAVVVTRDMTARLSTEDRLREARQASEHASRAKSEFLSRVSRELRTPLNAITGFSQLLQMGELGTQQAEAVDHILRAGGHLLDLIDEILDVARIESGHLELTLTPVAVSVADIVTDAVEFTGPMAGAADVSITVAIEPDSDVRIWADRQRLLQVLLNLLSNAVKYNRPGGRVTVTCEPADPDRVRLIVSDTGRGIRAEHVERVFRPFDRLDAGDSGVEGSGMGLALSQHLVERMGGCLGFESVPDIGSRFFVELATAPAGDMSTAVTGTSRLEPVPAGGVGGVFRVLLIEDELADLDLVERVLALRPNVELLAAMHGGLGIDMAREHMPDLILLDMRLPDMSGGTVLDRLAEDPATATVPVAVVGSDTAATEVRRLLGRGAVGYLTKPFDVHALLALVDAVRLAQSG